MDFSKSTKGGPFGSVGGRIPEGRHVPPPPKSAPDYDNIDALFCIFFLEKGFNFPWVLSKFCLMSGSAKFD